MVVRHLLSIGILPFTVTVLVPIWIGRQYGAGWSLARTPLDLLLQLSGLACLAAGLTLFVASLTRFAIEGEGTLAPWDPPRRLVVAGPYRFVRNPMISGVLFVLVAEALVLRSLPHAAWAATVFVINAIYIPLVEEPMLAVRFGEPYRDYCRNVRRLWPRLRPWSR
jgi:protein-S-isoprenylcysteine O-methyltransferase Ste14